MIMELIIHSLADREIFRVTAEKSSGFYAPVFINNLVDSCTGVLNAPVSSETLTEIDRKA
jgi:hypothetical protein